MKEYADYIGQEIVRVVNINALYHYRTAWHLLESALSRKIQAELDYYNGLICDFKDIKHELFPEDNTVKITAIITKCEVDC